ncbi:Conserved_hypothetical protein [Hexamita inflata]|uniref:NFACT RNA-binding domain-containing protein n=1 Tax=Hexamita inflata TaxID=28002 RepID=A0AA86TJL3_9EUKA|nr:Conserved hypothetical protein [Hexamita inflata]CAI9935109.1 Conserved hypothetical protein [Hexamita inflata]CAI9942519.1 Conserved hypothetical protein [Hexamita inflata]
MPLKIQSKTHPEILIYWGFDKFENEDLIKFAWEGDLWFHVDKHSSAHIYLRTLNQFTLDNLPKDLIEEAAQITKENSIEGCKLNNVCIIYTPAQNLLKDGSMDTGTVSFHQDKLVKRYHCAERDKEYVKWVEKNKIEDKSANLQQEKLDHEVEERKRLRAIRKLAEKEEREEADRRKQIKKEKDISGLYKNTEANNKNQELDFW